MKSLSLCSLLVASLQIALVFSSQYSATIDPRTNLVVAWNLTSTHLTISMSASVTGYISLGFSAARKMEDSFVVIGYINSFQQSLKEYTITSQSRSGITEVPDNILFDTTITESQGIFPRFL